MMAQRNSDSGLSLSKPETEVFRGSPAAQFQIAERGKDMYGVAFLSAEVLSSVSLSIGDIPQAVRLFTNAERVPFWLREERAQEELGCETVVTDESKKQPDVT